MKVVILAGGLGTRISEESYLKPKPMIEIGDKPILWHIMKIYSHYGFNDFIICLGYKGYYIKEFFANYYLHKSDVTFDFSKENKVEIHNQMVEPWRITLVDTGLETMTGGRIKRIQKYIGDETFLLTYGDGVSNLPIHKVVEFHRTHGKWATVTAVQPSGRYGALNIGEKHQVCEFQEKPKGDGSWINGGFFVLEPEVFNYLKGDKTIWEKEPLERIAEDHQLMAYQYRDFWYSMDTMRDKNHLENLWKNDKAPWKLW